MYAGGGLRNSGSPNDRTDAPGMRRRGPAASQRTPRHWLLWLVPAAGGAAAVFEPTACVEWAQDVRLTRRGDATFSAGPKHRKDGGTYTALRWRHWRLPQSVHGTPSDIQGTAGGAHQYRRAVKASSRKRRRFDELNFLWPTASRRIAGSWGLVTCGARSARMFCSEGRCV